VKWKKERGEKRRAGEKGRREGEEKSDDSSYRDNEAGSFSSL
jgi:hypothetical protein